MALSWSRVDSVARGASFCARKYLRPAPVFRPAAFTPEAGAVRRKRIAATPEEGTARLQSRPARLKWNISAAKCSGNRKPERSQGKNPGGRRAAGVFVRQKENGACRAATPSAGCRPAARNRRRPGRARNATARGPARAWPDRGLPASARQREPTPSARRPLRALPPRKHPP